MTQFTHKNLGIAALAALAIGVVTIAPAHADVTQLTFAQGLSAGDESIGYSATTGSVDSPLVLIGTTNTLTLTAQNGTTGAFFAQVSDGTSVDPVAFPAGTDLLETSAAPFATPSGPLQIGFSNGVQAFGLYAEDFAADTETFHFVVTSLSGVTSFDLPATDNSNNSGTGVFLGAYSSPGDLISGVVVSSDSSVSGESNDFIFGPIKSGSAVVPESSSLALFALAGAGLLGMVFVARRRSQTVDA